MSSLKNFSIVYATLLLIVGLVSTPLIARGEADFADFDLDALMDVRLTQEMPMGIHHVHNRGEWMVSYHFMVMGMNDLREGTSRRTQEEVLEDYMVTPTDMSMSMHMIGVMGAPSDRVTLMGMIPYVQNSMNHVNRMGAAFTTRSSGLGDVSASAMVSLHRTETSRFHTALGLSFPTGSIDARDDTPMGTDQRLPYPMQLGSGTTDLLMGVTYALNKGPWFWGGHGKGTIRLGENSNQYTLGNEYGSTIWGGHHFLEWMNTAFRLDAAFWDDVKGADPELNPGMVPTADPTLRSGRQIDATIGVNFYVPSGTFSNNRLALEATFPVHQSLDGPQLGSNWRFRAGWLRSF